MVKPPAVHHTANVVFSIPLPGCPGMSEPHRTSRWTQALCGVLFLATFLVYAHRIVGVQNSVEIKQHFGTDDAGYGRAEAWFGYGFAAGGLVFGILADLLSIRWLFPLVVLVWSITGWEASLAGTLDEYVGWRFALGLFQAAHWPCALRMTQRAFPPHQRTWGNGILQSGAAAAQVILPQILLWEDQRGAGWQSSFRLWALVGLPWGLAWLALVRESDVRRPVLQTDEQGAGAGQPREIREIPWYQIFTLRRWWLLLITVVGINVPWHALRVWMPDTLRTFYGYDKTFVDNFTSIYYLFAFVGSLAAGWLTAWLAGRGWNVHRARLAVFGLFAACVLLLVPAQWLSRGWALLGLQLVAALGTLGLAPLYYSFNQELSGKAQGKVGGSLSFLLWMILGAMQANIGTVVKTDPTWRPVIFAVVALLPLIAWGALVLGWGTRRTP